MASPRSYLKYHRHSKATRHGKSKQLNAFLAAEATRLTATAAQVFTLFAAKSRSADQVRAATSYADGDIVGF